MGKSSSSSGPYPSGDLGQPWPTSITPIPRATTNVYESPSIEMMEGGGAHMAADKKNQSNGLVSPHALLLSQLRSARAHVTNYPQISP